MNTKIKFCSIVLLFLLCSCGTHHIDEKYAASVVKDALSISGDVTAHELKGGGSGAPIFTVTSDSKKYVARFLEHKSKKDRQREIFFIKAASDGGYGPHVYFDDVNKAVIIMEFLQEQKISREQRLSEQLYVELSHLLQKIHHGPQFPLSRNIFDWIQEYLQKVKDIIKAKKVEGVPIVKLEEILATLSKVLTPHMTSAPCHNDMQPRNLIFLGNEFRAIDYEEAAQSDPYFDIATVAIYYCFDQHYEDVLLTTYLARQPSEQEKAKLYLMKLVAWIHHGFIFLKLGAEYMHNYTTLQVPSYWDFLRTLAKGNVQLEETRYQISMAKIMINDVFANFESQKFREAVGVLSKQSETVHELK